MDRIVSLYMRIYPFQLEADGDLLCKKGFVQISLKQSVHRFRIVAIDGVRT